MGSVEWESFKDVPSDKIYNMDKIGTDSSNRRTKVIADALANICQFQLTPEGDDRMNMHTTLVRATCIDGKSTAGWLLGYLPLYSPTLSCPLGQFWDEKNGVEGAPGPLCIHTDKLKTKVKEA